MNDQARKGTPEQGNGSPRSGRKKSRLVHKFLFFGLPLLLVSLFATSLVLSWVNYTFLKRTIRQDYENILKSSAEEIRYFISDAVKNLEALARVLSAIKPDRWQKQIALNAFKHVENRYMAVALLSMEGKMLVGNDWDEFHFNPLENPFMQQAVSGKTAISSVQFAEKRIPFIHIAVPITHLGETRAILYGQLDLKRIWDLMEGLSIGETGHVSIMDTAGRLVGDLDPERVVSGIPAQSRERMEAIQASKKPPQWVQREGGKNIFCMGMQIEDLNWYIVLHQDSSEIYYYLNRGFIIAGALTLLFLIIAAFAYWNWFKSILRPISMLDIQVRRISQGDLDHKISVESTDEIGDLARAFNKMTDDLKDMLAREVETARELAHNKNLAILGSASSRVSHEVGNFLGNLSMVTPVLKTEPISEKSRKYIKIIEEDCGRINQFIKAFLKAAKKPELALSRAHIGQILSDIEKIYESLAEEKHVRFVTEGIQDLPEILVDLSKIHHVFNNIVKNGMEAMPDGGTLSISGSKTDGFLTITISDTGTGMNPETMERIFEPFFTTKGNSGTGLGLSITKTIVESHGGTIECKSEPDRGTSFIIYLPAR